MNSLLGAPQWSALAARGGKLLSVPFPLFKKNGAQALGEKGFPLAVKLHFVIGSCGIKCKNLTIDGMERLEIKIFSHRIDFL